MAIASYKGMETLRGCTLYVTKMSCNVCAKLIAQSGIVEVVYKEKLIEKDVQDRSETLFKNCSVICRYVSILVFIIIIVQSFLTFSIELQHLIFHCA